MAAINSLMYAYGHSVPANSINQSCIEKVRGKIAIPSNEVLYIRYCMCEYTAKKLISKIEKLRNV